MFQADLAALQEQVRREELEGRRSNEALMAASRGNAQKTCGAYVDATQKASQSDRAYRKSSDRANKIARQLQPGLPGVEADLAAVYSKTNQWWNITRGFLGNSYKALDHAMNILLQAEAVSAGERNGDEEAIAALGPQIRDLYRSVNLLNPAFVRDLLLAEGPSRFLRATAIEGQAKELPALMALYDDPRAETYYWSLQAIKDKASAALPTPSFYQVPVHPADENNNTLAGQYEQEKRALDNNPKTAEWLRYMQAEASQGTTGLQQREIAQRVQLE